MSLVDKMSKHSLLGDQTAFSDPIDGMEVVVGPQFANFRNTAFPLLTSFSPEPDHTDIEAPIFDSILEKLLYEDYSYNRAAGDPDYNVTVPHSPSRGLFADLWDGDPPEASYNAFGKYDGISNGPEDGTYWS